ncbi:ATP-grasp domain-containing protein [Kitasatospora sp. NBC_01287]|uniref:ATP-grasp domain-containing protein n=1 Tax=Kitasatospora sp. NBC_01287 TaxID=2903573 RepID=UPI002251B091|nr:ATP-grasp domain-containing protein [Kitasatospora sp. NBC_01287]MCX4748955.1 ATP-grasp domain-containing protein [Kitasatospora sp. NBC_01287]
MPAPTILLPQDPLNPRRVDPHYSYEAQLVRGLGGETALIDHDALLAGDAAEAVRRVPPGIGPAWYRGWMLPVPAYAAFVRALADRGCNLLTSAAAYATAHELPGWYSTFEGATPDSVWLAAEHHPGELADAVARLGGHGPAIVKDFVKSRKHQWHEACFVPELADLPAVARVVDRFVELQGEFLAGGVVLRRFHSFVPPAEGSGGRSRTTARVAAPAGATVGRSADPTGDPAGDPAGDPTGGAGSGTRVGAGTVTGAERAAEARVWWVDGEPVLTGPHPDTPEVFPAPDLTQVRSLVRALGCRFVTTDLALLADGGGWMVVEVGDGQVSDLPRGTEVSGLLSSLIST